MALLCAHAAVFSVTIARPERVLMKATDPSPRSRGASAYDTDPSARVVDRPRPVCSDPLRPGAGRRETPGRTRTPGTGYRRSEGSARFAQTRPVLPEVHLGRRHPGTKFRQGLRPGRAR